MKKIKELFVDIIDFFKYNPFGIRSWYEKVTGTWAYAKFIWKNDIYREWDFWYLYHFIEFKLERMAKQLKKDDFVEGSSERCEEILKALAYLHIYNNIEEGAYDRGNINAIKEIYKQQKDAWVGFHEVLKEHAQKWWS